LGIISYTVLWIAAIITLITGIQYIMELFYFLRIMKMRVSNDYKILFLD
jgi:hypothetical protein